MRWLQALLPGRPQRQEERRSVRARTPSQTVTAKISFATGA